MARSQELKVTISGDARQLNRALGDAGRHMQRFGRETSLHARVSSRGFTAVGLAAHGAAAGVAAVGYAGYKFVQAATESERVAKQTTAVLKSTGGAANVSAKQVANLAGAISRKTGIDDEAIQSSENLLLTFTNIHNEVGKGNAIFTRATKTVTDMSVALGQDGKSSAIQLGKALNDPIKGITALQRVGVSFTASQKEQIKTLTEAGHRLDAQKMILRELNKEFGGSAAAQAQPLDKLKVAIGNVSESIGGALKPAVDAAATSLEHLAERVQPRLQRVADSIGRIFNRKDIDLGEKIKLSAGVVNRNLIQPLLAALRGAHIGEKLSDMFQEAVPKIVDAIAAAAPRAAAAFVNAFQNAGTWGKLLTLGFLLKKFGAFKAAGSWAAGSFTTAFQTKASPGIKAAGGRFVGLLKGAGWVGAAVVAADAFVPGFHRQLQEAFNGRKTKLQEFLDSYMKQLGSNAGRVMGVAIAQAIGEPGPTGYGTSTGSRPSASPNAGKGGGAVRPDTTGRVAPSESPVATVARVASAVTAPMARVASSGPLASMASAGPTARAAGGLSRQAFAVAVLRQLGITPTRANVKAFIGWENAEGGHWANDASFNPLNTTLRGPGAHSINSVGVKAYTSWAQGVNQTVKTLRMRAYGGIRRALRSGDPGAIASAIGSSPWGTNSSLIHRTIASAHVGRFRGGDSGGGFNPAWAQSRIGHYPESSGANRGRELDSLERGFGMTGAPWCAIFATTAAVKGGAPASIKTASVAQINQWAAQGSHGFEKGFKAVPRPGDLMTFGNDHVVIVMAVHGRTVSTLSGNSNRGPDGGVVRATYSIGSGRFARPRYRGGRAVDGAGTGTGVPTQSEINQRHFQGVSNRLDMIGLSRDAGLTDAVAADRSIISTIGQALHGKFGSLSAHDRLELRVTRRQTRQDLRQQLNAPKIVAKRRGQAALHYAYNYYVKNWNFFGEKEDSGEWTTAQANQWRRGLIFNALTRQGRFALFFPMTAHETRLVKADLAQLDKADADAADTADPTSFEGTAFDDAAMTMAQLDTPGDTSDDLRVLQGRLGIATAAYASAKASGDRAGIATWGGIVSSLQSDISSLGGSDGSDLTQALKDLKDSIDRQNQFAEQVTSVSLGEAWRALADVVSGQIAGVGYQGRAATAGSGAVARY